MRFWKITQGNSRCKVHAADYAGALARGAQIGFAAPDSVVLDDGGGDLTAAQHDDKAGAYQRTLARCGDANVQGALRTYITHHRQAAAALRAAQA